VIGGALLFASARAGFYWIAAGDILCIIAIMLSAWVLMVEILRWTRKAPTAPCLGQSSLARR
jgi:hypothetical protein